MQMCSLTIKKIAKTNIASVNFGAGLSQEQIAGLTDVGNGPGIIEASLTGTLEPDLAVDDDDPNLRFSSETASRVTESTVLAATILRKTLKTLFVLMCLMI